MRVALYARVSTEEQAIKGFSIDAQLDDLREFCAKHDIKVYDEYVDEGISARKKWTKREEFVRMIDDVRAGKIDLILFIKLDRWFRSVADYYEVQKILDEHGTVWRCTQEDCDTTTANGRLALNIKLAIAQDEADRTSERIKFVQANKVKNGEVISGSIPFGFYIDDKKHLRIDNEKMAIVEDAFNFYASCHSNRKTRLYIGNKYGIKWTGQTFKSMVDNTLYHGSYRGNDNYCPAPFSLSFMEELRGIKNEYGQWTRRAKHTYLFSGLLRCPVCGNRMSGLAETRRAKEFLYYRCGKHANYNACPYHRSIGEKTIENALLDCIEEELGEHIIKMEKAKKQVKKSDFTEVRKKMDRLEQLYIDGLISREKFDEQYLPLRDLTKAKREKDYSSAKKLIESDFRSLYGTLTQEQKRTMWRGILESIRISEDKSQITPIFL